MLPGRGLVLHGPKGCVMVLDEAGRARGGMGSYTRGGSPGLSNAGSEVALETAWRAKLATARLDGGWSDPIRWKLVQGSGRKESGREKKERKREKRKKEKKEERGKRKKKISQFARVFQYTIYSIFVFV